MSHHIDPVSGKAVWLQLCLEDMSGTSIPCQSSSRAILLENYYIGKQKHTVPKHKETLRHDFIVSYMEEKLQQQNHTWEEVWECLIKSKNDSQSRLPAILYRHLTSHNLQNRGLAPSFLENKTLHWVPMLLSELTGRQCHWGGMPQIQYMCELSV